MGVGITLSMHISHVEQVKRKLNKHVYCKFVVVVVVQKKF